MQTNQVKTCHFLFRDLLACNKKTDILLLTTTLIAYLHRQFNYVLALLISMLVLEALIFFFFFFCQNRPKIKSFLHKNC